MPNVTVRNLQTVNVRVNQGGIKAAVSTPSSAPIIVKTGQERRGQVSSTTQFVGVSPALKAEIEAAYNLLKLSNDAANNILAAANTLTLHTTVDTFVGDGQTSIFILSKSPFDANAVFVNISGVMQLKDSYEISGNNLTFSESPYVGETIEVTSLSVGNN
jgi:hypothetical protein